MAFALFISINTDVFRTHGSYISCSVSLEVLHNVHVSGDAFVVCLPITSNKNGVGGMIIDLLCHLAWI